MTCSIFRSFFEAIFFRCLRWCWRIFCCLLTCIVFNLEEILNCFSQMLCNTAEEKRVKNEFGSLAELEHRLSDVEQNGCKSQRETPKNWKTCLRDTSQEFNRRCNNLWTQSNSPPSDLLLIEQVPEKCSIFDPVSCKNFHFKTLLRVIKINLLLPLIYGTLVNSNSPDLKVAIRTKISRNWTRKQRNNNVQLRKKSFFMVDDQIKLKVEREKDFFG